MKKPLHLFIAILLSGILGFQGIRAQGNECINTIMLYLSPIEVEAVDKELHTAIKKALRSYLISEQQRYKFKLVSGLEDGDAVLDITYKLQNRGRRNQKTNIDIVLKDKQGIADEVSVSHQFSSDPASWMDGRNTLDHSEGKFIETLQRTDLMSTVFNNTKLGEGYQHLAKPEVIVVLEPMKTDDPQLASCLPCIEQLLLSSMKGYARDLDRSINIGMVGNEPTLTKGAKRVLLKPELSDKGTYYQVVYIYDDQILSSLTLHKHLLKNRLYNPFIVSTLRGQGWFLSDPISFD